MPFLRHLHIFIIVCCVFLASSVFVYYGVTTVPSTFPVGKSFIVEEDESLRSVSTRLEKEGYIHSALIFRAWLTFFGHDRHVQLGGYQFEREYSFSDLVAKLTSGRPDAPLIKVTIPEGSTLEEIAFFVYSKVPSIATSSFVSHVVSKNIDGYLFPSTYFLLPSVTVSRVVEIMNTTFKEKYKDAFALAEMPRVLRGEHDVIVLASIIEGEAKYDVDKKIIAGILLKRLEKGMPLQVDVARETYERKGLPDKPINNPGIDSIASIFNPVPTQYLFYITGNDGKMYYAKTFDEHKRNIAKYLR